MGFAMLFKCNCQVFCPVGTTVRCVILYIYDLLQLILTYVGLYVISIVYIRGFEL